jgi:hypothetical protein
MREAANHEPQTLHRILEQPLTGRLFDGEDFISRCSIKRVLVTRRWAIVSREISPPVLAWPGIGRGETTGLFRAPLEPLWSLDLTDSSVSSWSPGLLYLPDWGEGLQIHRPLAHKAPSRPRGTVLVLFAFFHLSLPSSRVVTPVPLTHRRVPTVRRRLKRPLSPHRHHHHPSSPN